MQGIRCRYLWTGLNQCLNNATVHISEEGMIESIQQDSFSSSDSSDFYFGMPSFVDAHIHLSWMVIKAASVDFSGVSSVDEFLSLLDSSVKNREQTIVRGESFDQSLWDEHVLPSLADLDSVTGDVPVFVRRVCGHLALVNSAMLGLMKDDSPYVNRLTGVLREDSAMGFEENFPLPEHIVRRAVSEVESLIHSKGVTAVFSMESLKNAALLLCSDSGLDLDVSIAVNVEHLGRLVSEKLPVGTVKLFLDGSFGAENAAVLQPYQAGGNGQLHYTDSELLFLLRRVYFAGFRPAFHAIGARALQQLDRVSGELFKILGKGFDIRVEHAEELSGAWPGTWDPGFHIFSMQPNFVERWQKPGGMYDTMLSPERAEGLNPFRTVLDSGFRLAFGSDCMPLDPLYGLRGALRHRNSSESISVHEALTAYTLGAASVSDFKHLSVPLCAGKCGTRTADMVFLSGNPFEEIDGISIEATMRRGSIVYQNRTSVEDNK